MSNPHQNILDLSADLLTRAYEVHKEFAHDIPRYDDLVNLYEELRLTRNGLDRLEVLLNDSIRLRARVENMKSVRQGNLEDAEIKVSTQQKSPKNEFQSARDAGVSLNAKTISERRDLRQITEAFTEVKATVDIIKNFHYAMNGRRRDLDAAMKISTFVSAYER